MIESNINEGNQKVTDDTNNLQYNGQNVVDVMYADSNGTLQQVELNMGGTLVWAKGTS